MKFTAGEEVLLLADVTPCVGVWIEILTLFGNWRGWIVTPCVGVWIEIYAINLMVELCAVTPCVGVWIEIL